MPTYTFECTIENDGCGYSWETFLLMSDYHPNNFPECPSCGQKEATRRNFEADLPRAKVETLTVGALAEKNSDRLSQDEKDAIWHRDNAYKFQPTKKLPKGMKYMRGENGELNISQKQRKKDPRKKRRIDKNVS